MALGNSAGFGNSGPLIFLSPRSKDKDKKECDPHFTVGRSVEGKIVDDKETVTNVGGDLFRLEFKEREYNGEVSEEVILYLKDKEANEAYRLPIRFGVAGRGLFNKLITLSSFEGLQIGYYRNKAGYDAFSLKQGDQSVKWKYENDKLPAALEIKHPTSGKVLQRDYSEINKFFKAELEAVAAKVNKAKPAEKAEAAPKPTTAGKPANTDAQDSDVPF